MAPAAIAHAQRCRARAIPYAGAIAPAGPDFEAAGPDFEAAGPDFSEAAGPDFSEAAGPEKTSKISNVSVSGRRGSVWAHTSGK